MLVESLAEVAVVDSEVWLLLHEASRARAATGVAQRAEAFVQEERIIRGVSVELAPAYDKLAAIDTKALQISKLLLGFQVSQVAMLQLILAASTGWLLRG
jgi:hypothetical protein